MELKNQCIAGCKSFEGGEIRHHKNCPNYPESFSQMYDELVEKHRWIPVSEKLPPRSTETRQVFFKNAKKHKMNWFIVSCFDDTYLEDIEFIKREFTHWKEIEL